MGASHLGLVWRMQKYPHLGGLTSDRDCDGNSPLHLAAINGNHHCYKTMGGGDGDRGRDKKNGRHHVLSAEKVANNLLLVATLIITVTFAAIITMPGGFESDPTTGSNNGTAVLANRSSFQAFVIMDTLGFLFAFWAAIRLVWTIFWRGAALVVDIGLAKMMVHAALMAMTLAFGMGAYSMLNHRCHWLGMLTLIMACVFSLAPYFGFLSY
ncbi:hypothetical protein QJS10_CPA09g01284 [Acorus calamus]|uniref:PGG domain-containing protein n=1 Tax=Acorus calamus TaxID=4465 RepID=A0AAV9E7B5_ACOCL|nr:hypothetical protein QJS10_CPA09g01284 [Acorus calamus]